MKHTYIQSNLGSESNFAGQQANLDTLNFTSSQNSTLQSKIGFLNTKRSMIDAALFALIVVLIMMHIFIMRSSADASVGLATVFIIPPFIGALTAKLLNVLLTNREYKNSMYFIGALGASIGAYYIGPNFMEALTYKHMIGAMYGSAIVALYFIFVQKK